MATAMVLVMLFFSAISAAICDLDKAFAIYGQFVLFVNGQPIKASQTLIAKRKLRFY
jgi:hypothetical protein